MALATVCNLQTPAPAAAADISLDPMTPGGLVVTDVANESNGITVRAEPGQVIFDDSSAVLTATAPQCAAATPQQVRCSSIGLSRLIARLGGGDDAFRLDDPVVTATAVRASVEGGAGNDVLVGAAGDDVLAGGDGHDVVDGGAGNDILAGNDGHDVVRGGPGQDRLTGERGSDLVQGGDDNDWLDGGEAEDSLAGGTGEDVVLGGAGSDSVDGGPGADALDGGPGDDLVEGGPEPDTVNGGAGTDLFRTRDGVRDAVDCGGGSDLAIVDRAEAITNCDRIRVDRGLRPRPPFGLAARALPERGTVELRVEGADTFYPLQDVADIPLRSALDTSKGTANVITTKRRGGPIQEASLRGGAFTVHQARIARPFTELRLTGGDVGACGARGSASARQVRQLETHIGKRRGKYRVRGRYSTAAAFGTTWVTVDRCDGTLTQVITGAVHVHDFGRNRTVVVRAGHSYLARAR